MNLSSFMENLVELVACTFIFGMPLIAVILYFVNRMYNNKQEREVRQLIIENRIDSETAKLLLDEPKKQPRKAKPYYLNTLRRACILLGLGLGALADWLMNITVGSIYFWFVVAAGLGIGLLCSFFVEMQFYKKHYLQKIEEQTNEAEEQN